MVKDTIKTAVDGYSGGPVDHDLVQAALDFMVAIQPSSEDPDGGRKYAIALDEHAATIRNAESIFRAFGSSIEPLTLDAMQSVFYKVVKSPRYSVNPDSQSCVYTCLNRAWRGIGPWQG